MRTKSPAGLLTLLPSAVLPLLQPTEVSQSVLAMQAADVSTTGSVFQTGAGSREWTDPVRPSAAPHGDVSGDE